MPWILVGVLTLTGLLFRVIVFGESGFGDELSTLWIVRNNDLAGVVSIVHTDAEITPPLYFLLAKITSVFGPTISSVRLPSLLAGVGSLPLVYAAGRRLIGSRGALAATLLATVSPFLVYFSAQARNYAVMIFLLLLATLLILEATAEGGRWWHWAGWSLVAALALFSQYTAGFVILAQVLWVFWFFPAQRLRMAGFAVLAGLLFMPWITGLRADLDSPTADIMQALQGSSFTAKREAVEQLFFHWIEASPPTFFHRPDMMLATAGAVVGLVAVIWRLAGGRLNLPQGERARGVWLAVAMVASVFICTLVLLALGTDIFGARNLAPAWVGMPFLFGSVFVAAGRRAGWVFLILMIAGFMVSTTRLMDPNRSTINYSRVADQLDDSGEKGTILDASIASPAPLTSLDAYLETDLPVFKMTAIEDRPDYIKQLFATYDAQKILDRAFSGAGPVRVVTADDFRAPREITSGGAAGGYEIQVNGQTAVIPPGWEPVSSHRYPGLEPLTVTVFERSGQTGKSDR